MNSPDLSKWTAIAEIAGAMAVVISLIFVAVSLNRNTKELFVANENFLYQLQDDEFSDVASDADLAAILSKLRRKEALSDVESVQFEHHISRLMNRWELVFARHQGGFMSAVQWEDWDRFYTSAFVAQFPSELWPEWRYAYSQDFAEHVDRILSEN
jgi:hypothetical protein